MDSQITLVNPVLSNSNNNGEVLLFNSDSMWNAVITRESDLSGSPLYTIKSDEEQRETIIYRSNGSVVATITCRLLLADQISFGNEPSVSCNKWLKTGLILTSNQL
jgi:hypothetical protein